MPPRTRTKIAKDFKENINVTSKLKREKKVSKPLRKALADKTNSLSDGTSPLEASKKVSKETAITKIITVDNPVRPKRERRLPTRYAKNHLLNNLSNSKDSLANSLNDDKTSKTEQDVISNKNNLRIKKSTKTIPTSNQENKLPTKIKSIPKKKHTSNNAPSIINKSTHTPLKISKKKESSIIFNRPKRIHKFPARFHEQSMSPSKFGSVLPTFASTPLPQKESKKKIVHSNNDIKKINSRDKSSPDTNNNPKKSRVAKQSDVKIVSSPLNVSVKLKSPIFKTIRPKRLLNKSNSFKVLEDKQSKKNCVDVYEFTFDPNEEPPPQKKKKKRVIKKKPPKPKTVVFSNNYEQNLSRTLARLKKAVSKKSAVTTSKPTLTSDKQNTKVLGVDNLPPDNINSEQKICSNDLEKNQEATKINQQQIKINENNIPNRISNITHLTLTNNLQENESKTPAENDKKLEHNKNFASIRIEDIAADFEIPDNNDDINYSPVNSPLRPITPIIETQIDNLQSEKSNEIIAKAVNNNDPLNLQDNLSFFENQPVANSSMIVSRHPLASPWRAEFESLPIKWQVNTYVKPNMTPAVESSFITPKDDSKKKHVYTNLVPQSNESLPQIVENTSQLKQPSIISFFKEVLEKSASKKKKALSNNPAKASVFQDITNDVNKNKPIPEKTVRKEDAILSPVKNLANKENARENRKRKNDTNINAMPAKSPCRQKNKDHTFFGFDDSENQVNENVSPEKIDNRVRALRPRSRAVLQEINGQMGPMRAEVPVSAKLKLLRSSEAVNKVYEQVKAAETAPTFDNEIAQNTTEITSDNRFNDNDADSNSVHLFEDIELIHHLKPTRKSYSKPKKVAFRQNSISDDDTQENEILVQSDMSDVDDFGDLTFVMPEIKNNKRKPVKKKKVKTQLSSKEKKEADAWAASFNSMCEDIEGFPLVVE